MSFEINLTIEFDREHPGFRRYCDALAEVSEETEVVSNDDSEHVMAVARNVDIEALKELRLLHKELISTGRCEHKYLLINDDYDERCYTSVRAMSSRPRHIITLDDVLPKM